MTQYELDRTITEYDVAKTSIQQTPLLGGYEGQLQIFKILCDTPKHLPTDKTGVLYQNEFLNETYKDFLENKRPIRVTLNKLKKWFDNLIVTQKEILDWESFFVSNGNNLIDVLQTHYDTMPDRIYWKMLSACYVRSSFAHADIRLILYYLNAKRPEKEYLMDEEEREFFRNLPNEVTIYRGCTKKEIKSGKYRISWTLDKKVAEFFAFTYRNSVHEVASIEKDITKFDVVVKTVNKKDLLCYFGGRNEAEVLYMPNN